jgi:hypothetical protein
LRIPRRLALAVLAAVSCSGRPHAAPDAAPPSGAVSGPSAFRAASETPSTIQLPAICSIGTGDPHAHCDARGTTQLWPEVDAAIDELVRTRPLLFNLDRVVGQKGYFVLAHDELYLGVAAILQAKGLCAQYDYRVLHVKNSQATSEQYDLVQPNGHLRRDPTGFSATCSPAAFPLDPAVVIDRVRVAFYAIQCDDGRTPPRNGEGVLPSDCTGYVTATPKKDDDSDVPRQIHGPDIVWELEQQGNQVDAEDFPNVAFNKVLRGRDPGTFRLCATVETHRGCLDGVVTP